jgi:hypothetical protein
MVGEGVGVWLTIEIAGPRRVPGIFEIFGCFWRVDGADAIMWLVLADKRGRSSKGSLGNEVVLLGFEGASAKYVCDFWLDRRGPFQI